MRSNSRNDFHKKLYTLKDIFMVFKRKETAEYFIPSLDWVWNIFKIKYIGRTKSIHERKVFIAALFMMNEMKMAILVEHGNAISF